MLDPDHPFFAPVWRRWAVIGVCFGWALFELSNGATLWAGGFAGLGAYAFWALILGPRIKR
ncbi:hypothetical protein JANAI62_24590 [Jannaschia pagri]|uniref:DUF3329 domain-containing protein n=1 Tax=Jannaschia pagri TaxID=2829797 RepID=A0ABQ4NNB3_9RHOB|nr:MULTISPECIES: hypothetical protein [unclassified Jannaschia]GIT92002.1 hypothetical protein JANAI61_24600 [Jannaschia sp. AI_61]GIT95836.1 hypothetical protein JANAI62_24590 [Jannaschia sp. AI_62]